MMNRSLAALFILLFLGSCSSEIADTAGLTGTGGGASTSSDPSGTSSEYTPPIAQPSPPVVIANGQLQGDRLTISGQVVVESGSAEGIIVTVTNVTTGEQQQATVSGDGTFTITITVSAGDLIEIVASDPATGQVSPALEAVVPNQDEEIGTTTHDGPGTSINSLGHV